MKDRLPTKGRRFPFELLVGNHEADGGPDGRIRRHAACLPDRLDAGGKYARQYAFPSPGPNPLARFIMIAPRLRVDGHTYRYGPGTADRQWLVRQIDSARAAGTVGGRRDALPVPVHRLGPPRLRVGPRGAQPAAPQGRRRDAVGHNHVYERSKQLALSADCPSIPPGEYDADCVADSGADGSYAAGAGTVQVTSGRFGGRPMTLDHQDPDEPYFAATDAGTTGFTAFTVTGRPARRALRRLHRDLPDSFVIGADRLEPGAPVVAARGARRARRPADRGRHVDGARPGGPGDAAVDQRRPAGDEERDRLGGRVAVVAGDRVAT